jgi:hypothetical protein
MNRIAPGITFMVGSAISGARGADRGYRGVVEFGRMAGQERAA